MKFLLSLLIISILSYIAGIYFAWWSVAVVAFAVSLFIAQKPLSAWLSGFLGVFIIWVIMAAYMNHANAGILAGRIGAVLKTGSNPNVLIVITGLVGGVVAGMAALSAAYLHRSKRV